MDSHKKQSNREAGGGFGDHFHLREKVEVCFDEDGFRGSWFPATVLRTLKLTTIHKNLTARADSDTGSGTSSSGYKYRKIYLEFNTLTSKADKKKGHRQYVDFLLVRPAPPRETHRSFSVNEEVDAYHNDGWWEGFIIDVIPPANPDEPTSYSVYFRGSREQIVFPETDIRLHREWVYGEWVPPLQDETPPPPLPPQHAASSPRSSHANLC